MAGAALAIFSLVVIRMAIRAVIRVVIGRELPALR